MIGEGEHGDIDFLRIIKDYAKLRPTDTPHSRFFLSMRNGKCTRQPIGINTFGSYPSKIATFLGLQSPNDYTGHCFRRSSASLLVEAGASVDELKRHGGWVSSKTAEGYVETSLVSKRKICDLGTKVVKLAEKATSSISTQITKRVIEIQGTSSASSDETVTLAGSRVIEIRGPSSSSSDQTVTLAGPSDNSNKSGRCSFGDLHNCTFNIYNN